MQPSSAALIVSRVVVGILMASAILRAPAQAQTFTVLHTFHGTDGSGPIGPLILDSAGNLYGTTAGGGSGTGCPNLSNSGCGTAFMLNKAGKQVALYSFNGPNGAEPGGGLFRDAKGNFYGTTQYGGATSPPCPDGGEGCGVVFKLNKAGKEKEYKFKGTPDGFNPAGPLVEDLAGNLYGTTRFGGQNGLGTVFRIDATGEETVLYSFTGGTDGCDPTAGVILDSAGNLYGVTDDGGAGFCNSGDGVVFKVDPAGTETVLHTFGGGDGANPSSVLIFDTEGNLYGTTGNGGSSEGCGFSGCGTVFELSPQENGTWSETVLYSFCSLSGCTDGEEPGGGPLVRDSSGNLSGTTYFGGRSDDGVVFKLNTSGDETVLYSFTGGSDGANPAVGLAMDGSGNLYGTTQDRGATCFTHYTCGVVFKIVP